MSHHRGGTRHHLHSGRDNVFYLYEEPNCVTINGVKVCPDTGALGDPGTLERRSPLPAGHYWVDVFGKNIPVAANWFKAFSGLGVHVDSTEHFTATEVPEVRDWYLFTYTPTAGVPVVWDTTLGYPTIADASIKNSQDTVSGANLPKDPLDRLADWLNDIEQELGGSIGGAAKVVPYAIMGGAAFGVYLLAKEFGLLGKVKKRARSLRNK